MIWLTFVTMVKKAWKECATHFDFYTVALKLSIDTFMRIKAVAIIPLSWVFYFKCSVNITAVYWKEATILAIIFWDILMFDKIFVSPQVKRIVIISNKHGIYELPNDLRLRALGN